MNDARNGSLLGASDSRHHDAPVGAGAAPGAQTLPWVVVLDDDDGIRRLMSIILQRHGYHVSGVSGVAEARALLKASASDPHLIVVDLKLPKSSGLVIAEEIRRTRPSVKLLFTSGFSKHSVFIDGREVTAREYLPKPFSVYGLLAKVEEVLHG